MSEGKKTVSLTIDREVYDQLDDACRRLRQRKSMVVSNLLDYAFRSLYRGESNTVLPFGVDFRPSPAIEMSPSPAIDSLLMPHTLRNARRYHQDPGPSQSARIIPFPKQE